jgi:hypothetical protein
MVIPQNILFEGLQLTSLTGDTSANILADKWHTVRSEVLTAMFMKKSVFCDITTCNPLKANRRFGGI